MNANRRRGEIAATLDGEEQKLRLTLGALAELEATYEVEDLAALVERFSGGKLAARDIIRIIGAGLRGAGREVTDEEVGNMDVIDGIAGMAKIAVSLLEAAFGGREETNGGEGVAKANP